MIIDTNYSVSPGKLLATAWNNRSLVWQLVKRDVLGRYKESILGVTWSLFNPLLMLGVYTFVFSVVFNMKWGLDNENRAHFAVVLFVGMIVHSFFSELVNKAPTLILSNVNFVKKIVFPLELLPLIALISSLFHFLVSFLVMLLAQFYVAGEVYWTTLLIPVILLPLCLLMLGIGWFLASFGVYVRDVGQIIGMITSVMLFLAPIFYPLSALPEKYQLWLMLNPLTIIIEQARAVVIYGGLPDVSLLAKYSLVSVIVSVFGYIWFQKTRRGFSDVV